MAKIFFFLLYLAAPGALVAVCELLGAVRWEHEVLASGLPGKSH